MLYSAHLFCLNNTSPYALQPKTKHRRIGFIWHSLPNPVLCNVQYPIFPSPLRRGAGWGLLPSPPGGCVTIPILSLRATEGSVAIYCFSVCYKRLLRRYAPRKDIVTQPPDKEHGRVLWLKRLLLLITFLALQNQDQRLDPISAEECSRESRPNVC